MDRDCMGDDCDGTSHKANNHIGLCLAVTLVGVPVLVTATGNPGLGVFLGLLFAIHESGILATVHIRVMAAFKELLEFEHVGLNYSILFRILYVVSLRLSNEHLLLGISIQQQRYPFLT